MILHPVVLACLACCAAGVVVIVRWGGIDFAVPWAPEDGTRASVAEGLRRVAWSVDVVVISGLVSGLLAAGPAGRLAMRLLAATAGDAAQGRQTEAEEVVGRITVSGTIGFLVFVGILGGLFASALFGIVRHWLPARRLGGLVFGGLLLVVVAPRIDPLRSDNVDFDLVGPGWLALVVLSAVVFFDGLVLAAVAGRVGRALPLFGQAGAGRRHMLAYAPLLLLAAGTIAFVALLLAATAATAGAAVAAVAARPAARRGWADPRAMVAGRVVLVGVGIAAAPGFVAAVAEIL